MIAQSERDHLRAQLKQGDLRAAAQIYVKIANRPIHPTMIEKYLKHQRPFTGRKAGSHQPLQIHQAIAQAIKERTDRENDTTQKAHQLVQAILRDTTPPKPIPI